MRAVTLPGPVLAVLAAHLDEYAPSGETGLLFTGDEGGPLRRSNFNRRVGWIAAVDRLGAPGLHFHNLRHTGNTLAAGSGASLRDLMIRMGHDTMRAALIYQHATRNADQHIADGLARDIEAQTEPPDTGPDTARTGQPQQHADSTRGRCDRSVSGVRDSEGAVTCGFSGERVSG